MCCRCETAVSHSKSVSVMEQGLLQQVVAAMPQCLKVGAWLDKTEGHTHRATV